MTDLTSIERCRTCGDLFAHSGVFRASTCNGCDFERGLITLDECEAIQFDGTVSPGGMSPWLPPALRLLRDGTRAAVNETYKAEPFGALSWQDANEARSWAVMARDSAALLLKLYDERRTRARQQSRMDWA